MTAGGGGDEGTRTPDPCDANAVLSQLSYIPTNVRLRSGAASLGREYTPGRRGPRKVMILSEVPPMGAHPAFSLDEAADAAGQLGTDLDDVSFDLEELRLGMDVELEDISRDPESAFARADPLLVAKVALGHLHERSDYYTRLARMEADATETD
jgi:hypothetical protein